MNPTGQKTIYPISLGCPKNLVDSEKMLGEIARAGFIIAESPEGADVILINTCSFLKEAEDESYDIIKQACSLRDRKEAGAVVVAGCLPQKYRKNPPERIRRADGLIGVADREKVVALLHRICEKKTRRRRCITHLENLYSPITADTARLRLTEPHYAYIKIAEGCSNKCTYCIIPKIRGPYRSKPMEMVLDEVREMTSSGTREVILIAEDTTLYGTDIYGKPKLHELLAKIGEIEGVSWLRILYTHPAHVNDALIDEMASNPRVCKYIDMPIQHASDKILRLMGRKVSRKKIENIVERLRQKVENIFIRTAVITGFPGETTSDFDTLLDFIRRMRFERLGAFMYSRQKNTPANSYAGHLSEEEKHARWSEVMQLQQAIAFEYNRSLVGKELDVIVDRQLNITDETDITSETISSSLSGTPPCRTGLATVPPGTADAPRVTTPPPKQQSRALELEAGETVPDAKAAHTQFQTTPESITFTHLGRTYGDAPEVDGCIFLAGEGLKPGHVTKAFVVATRNYDLLGICDAFPIRKSRPTSGSRT